MPCAPSTTPAAEPGTTEPRITGSAGLETSMTNKPSFPAEEVEMRNGYRRIRPRWQLYEADMHTPVGQPLRLDHLEATIKAFFDANEIQADWDALKKLSSASLVDFLSTNLPFAVEEKQALVEAPSVVERTESMLQTKS